MSLTLELVDFEYNTLSSLSGWALSISWKPKENKKTSLPPSKRESRSKRLWTWIEMLPFLDFCPLAGPPSSFWTCRRKLPYICIVQSFSCLWLCNPMDFSTPDFPVLYYLKIMFIELVMPSNNLILCHPLRPLLSMFPSIKDSWWLFASGGQNIGASASVSVLPMNSQAWFPLGLIGLISL